MFSSFKSLVSKLGEVEQLTIGILCLYLLNIMVACLLLLWEANSGFAVTQHSFLCSSLLDMYVHAASGFQSGLVFDLNSMVAMGSASRVTAHGQDLSQLKVTALKCFKSLEDVPGQWDTFMLAYVKVSCCANLIEILSIFLWFHTPWPRHEEINQRSSSS